MVDSGWLIDHASGRQIKADTESPPVTYIEVLP
jgi:hypothetical protein